MVLSHLALAFLMGIVAAGFLTFPAVFWFYVSAAALLLSAIAHKLTAVRTKHSPLPPTPDSRPPNPYSRSLSPTLILFTAVLLGGARFQSHTPLLDNPEFIAAYNDTGVTYTVTGLLTDPPDVRDFHTNLRIEVEQIRPRDDFRHLSVRGMLLARVENGTDWRYGDRVTITGQLQTPPVAEDFSYRDYLAREGVYSFMSRAYASGVLSSGNGSPIYRIIFAIKSRALDTIYLLFPDPEASLLAGILLGVETGISQDLADDFRDTGTSHIVAISGFNITIIAGIFASMFGRVLGVRRGAVAAVIGISVYTILVGADAAVVRAAVMGVVVILAKQAGRRAAGFHTLILTAFIMAFANPLILGDVGFQLSFAATLGLLLYGEPLQGWAERTFERFLPENIAKKAAGPFSEFFLLTIAAQITTLPLMVYYFERISLISFVVNPLILPVQPAVMIVGGIVTILGMIFLPLGQASSSFAWVFVAFTIRVVEFFADAPAGVLVLGRVSILFVILIYGVIFALELWRGQLPDLSGWFAPSSTVFALGLVAFVVWGRAFAPPDGMLHLTFLDVGSGDAILIRTPEGRHILIDGGPSTTRLSDSLGRRLPMGQRALDYLIVGAPFDPQVEALPRVLDRFPPDTVLWAGPAYSSRAARLLREDLTAAQTPIVDAVSGQTLDLGGGGSFRVLTHGARGAVFLLEWENFRALLPIGLDFEAMSTLNFWEDLGPVTVLMMAEGGYAPLAPPEWITNLRPSVAVISVGAGDLQGMPSPETLERLDGYNILRTDRSGWIHMTTDGTQLWVETER